ncbi:hypothetical protein ElyMa_001307400 [Elysia marginata]|uniref:Uncharacterized protein n=1 Tax=Elysia marginata TaxID=1093978 RepID=A0AAV4IIS2_9GAST|nr:hypothetical protein ElyMa_001307400 [Elysia marginata]
MYTIGKRHSTNLVFPFPPLFPTIPPKPYNLRPRPRKNAKVKKMAAEPKPVTLTLFDQADRAAEGVQLAQQLAGSISTIDNNNSKNKNNNNINSNGSSNLLPNSQNKANKHEISPATSDTMIAPDSHQYNQHLHHFLLQHHQQQLQQFHEHLKQQHHHNQIQQQQQQQAQLDEYSALMSRALFSTETPHAAEVDER